MPVIWKFRNPRAYLQHLSDYLKDRGSFSFRSIALEAELASPNYVQKFLLGTRQFKEETAFNVARAYGLEDDEAQFFVLLCQFDSAKTITARREAYRTILDQAVRHGAARLDSARLQYFSHWFIPAVHALASLHGFQYDSAWIAQALEPRIRKKEAQMALEVLDSLGILVKTDDGTGWHLREPELETDAADVPDAKVQSVWMHSYNQAMIQLGQDASMRWDKRVRNVSSLTVTLRQDQVEWLVRRIDQFRNQLFSDILSAQNDSDAVEGDVYQINMQAFPLTKLHVRPESQESNG